MDDFIPRNAVLAKSYFHGGHSTWDNPFANGRMAIDEADIWDIPAADVAPVRYGCWNADKEDVEWGNSLIRYRCSVCNKRPPFDKEEYKFILSPYCPNCGAKMAMKDVEKNE